MPGGCSIWRAIIWALIYDTEYAMVDREDDIKIGREINCDSFGEYDRLMIGLLQLTMLALLIAVGSKLSWAL